MIKTHFVFAVSFVALMAVSSAWATDPADTSSTTDTVATEHTVYTNQTPTSGAGIAGVSYVNKAVNKAGASAQAAEAHAAAAGASALSAAGSAAAAAASAATANEALVTKADITYVDGQITTVSGKAGELETAVEQLQSDMDDLATVASTGSYNDLSNKPTIGNATITIQKNGTAVDTFTANATSDKSINIAVPTKVSELTNDSNYATTSAVNAKVATAQGDTNKNKIMITNASGSVTPVAITSSGTGSLVTAVSVEDGKLTVTKGSSLPTVNNATLTIQKNGTTVDSFTANASKSKTVNITVPTKVTDLSDASSYATTEYVDGQITTVSGKAGELETELEQLQSDMDDLATVASTGSYNDLSNKPTIGNATITIQKNGTAVDTFTANATSDKSINIAVPTKVSELTNDSNYATTSAVNAKVATAQGDTNKNKIMITNASGSVTPVAITSSGTGSLVTAVSVEDGKLTVTKGSSLPTVNNATLTIQKNGTTVDSFTANASKSKTVNITVPTKVTDLSDASSYATTEYVDGQITTVSGKAGELETELEQLQSDMDDLATVASTGSYNDLSNKPTIGNATITIQKNGTAVDTFTANATSDKSINIAVPTKVSELTNDSNYATTSAVNAKQNTLTATGAADRPVYATNGGVAAVTGISIPVGTSTATGSTSWAKIWVE